MKNFALVLGILVFLYLAMPISSALIVEDVQTPTLSPGQEGAIILDVTNDGTGSVHEISFTLDFTNLPFIPIGSSEAGIQKLNEDKSKTFTFLLSASPDAKPGDYKIPYTLNAKNITVKKGAIGIRVTGNSVLSFTLTADKPVMGERSKVNLKMINAGLTDARFVSLKLLVADATLLSEDQIYIGTINSDDFESTTFDIIFTDKQPRLTAFVSYKDFNNKDQTLTDEVPLTIYSREKALELGIINKNNTFWYVLTLIVIIILWVAWRSFRKRQRLKKSKELAARR